MHYDPSKYKVYTWKNWMMLHWIINPGLAFNELILGQRVPEISLEDKTIDKPRVERSFVPCPHCGHLHDGRTWSTHNGTAFKNWFGLYCPNCGGIIPCLMNATSALVLLVTAPLWIWFYRTLKSNWLAAQPARYAHLDLEQISNPFDEKSWYKSGLSFGFTMFLLMEFLLPVLEQEPLSWKKVLIGIPVWAFSGLIYGYMMKQFSNFRPSRSA